MFSSRVDNYPLILCEALSIGVPVIATHSDAAREVLQNPVVKPSVKKRCCNWCS